MLVLKIYGNKKTELYARFLVNLFFFRRILHTLTAVIQVK